MRERDLSDDTRKLPRERRVTESLRETNIWTLDRNNDPRERRQNIIYINYLSTSDGRRQKPSL